jgi:hypothetical protein
MRRLDDIAALAQARLFLRRYRGPIVIALLCSAAYAGSLWALSAEQAGCHR